MTSDEFPIDKLLYDVLTQGGLAQFTIPELSDAYAQSSENGFRARAILQRYLYEEILRMVQVGWVVPVPSRRSRLQVYQLMAMPRNLKAKVVDRLKGMRRVRAAKRKENVAPVSPDAIICSSPGGNGDAKRYLMGLLEEIRLDFLSSKGEAERYLQLLDELPQLKGQIEGEYLEVRDRSARLHGHLRAVEKTIATLGA
jgi:hypothetical protein